MTQRSTFSQADVTRLIKGAIRGGWPVGSFKVVVENGAPALVPLAAEDKALSQLEAWELKNGHRAA